MSASARTLPPVDRATLVATRRDLHQHPELDLPGAVKFAFQPAEEISFGADAMIGDGVLDRPSVDAAFGIHLWNDLPTGKIGLMPGPVMASVDEFEIAILGTGGHAAAPHQTTDPVLAAAHVDGTPEPRQPAPQSVQIGRAHV